MYFDEDLVLDLRLNLLDDQVDYFVIVESKFNHKGEKRELKFDIDRYQRFKKKILYLVYDQIPNNLDIIKEDEDKDITISKYMFNAGKRENSQRNFIVNGLTEADNEDLILISDVDEIPNLQNLDFSKINKKIIMFKQEMFYYKFNLKLPNFSWIGTKACKKKNLKSPQWLRNIKDRKFPFYRLDTLFSDNKYSSIKFIDNGGWHFTNIKTPEEIYLKLNTFLHNVDFKLSGLELEDIKKMVKEKKILYDHFADQKKIKKWDSPVTLEAINILNLPEYIINNKDKFKKWIE